MKTKIKIKKITINNYTFTLKYNEDGNSIISGNFEFNCYPERDMTKKELLSGQKLLEKIFDGQYDEQLLEIVFYKEPRKNRDDNYWCHCGEKRFCSFATDDRKCNLPSSDGWITKCPHERSE